MKKPSENLKFAQGAVTGLYAISMIAFCMAVYLWVGNAKRFATEFNNAIRRI